MQQGFCGPHFRRTGRKISAKHEVGNERMCSACFTGKAIFRTEQQGSGSQAMPRTNGKRKTAEGREAFRRYMQEYRTLRKKRYERRTTFEGEHGAERY
jgi:hypothetical protein